jgi:hypothetical protein
MNEVHYMEPERSTTKEKQLLKAAKTAKTKTDNTLSEIRKAIEDLEADNIRASQANVIRKLNGKLCRRTVVTHWKNLFPKPQADEIKNIEHEFVEQQKKPVYLWGLEELGVPTLAEERKLNPGKSDAVLLYYILAMREMRIKELQRVC